MEKVYIVETLEAPSGKEELLKKELLKLAALSRKEEGCLYYNLYQDLDKPRRLTILMCYKSRESYDEHSQSPYIQEFVDKCEGVLYGDVIEDLYRGIDIR
ncbi:MAG: antibiotic biosynthesis monooxygenase [Verrucomicrobia bacterium]|nr:antibiotic biosynthesis monooxygenase [Verrucomicrobiota bacterium]